jgi:hypothetical protein
MMVIGRQLAQTAAAVTQTKATAVTITSTIILQRALKKNRHEINHLPKKNMPQYLAKTSKSVCTQAKRTSTKKRRLEM